MEKNRCKKIIDACIKNKFNFTIVTDENYSIYIDPYTDDKILCDVASGLLLISKDAGPDDFCIEWDRVKNLVICEIERILMIDMYYRKNDPSDKQAVADAFATDEPVITNFLNSI